MHLNSKIRNTNPSDSAFWNQTHPLEDSENVLKWAEAEVWEILIPKGWDLNKIRSSEMAWVTPLPQSKNNEQCGILIVRGSARLIKEDDVYFGAGHLSQTFSKGATHYVKSSSVSFKGFPALMPTKHVTVSQTLAEGPLLRNRDP